MPAPQLTSFSRQAITSIYIGIDFGTSYTKVSYSYAPSHTPQIQTIKWNNEKDSFFKQTILYIQNGRLYFDKPVGDSKEVKYFKYSIIETKLKNNSVQTKNNFEKMCCVYFLAQMIKRSIAIIQEKLHIANMDDIKTFVNMGVPLENFYEEKNKNNMGLYQEILEDAVLLAGGCKIKAVLPKNQVLISNLDSVFSEIEIKRAIPNWGLNVYPELAAELLLYHQSKFIGEGIYAIIDIGGGTVDMALFHKKIEKSSADMFCLAQKVLPYGIEILCKEPDSVSADQFTNEFSSMLMNARNYADVHYERYNKIDVFFLGGGASNDWYLNNIKRTNERFKGTCVPPLSFSHSIEDFINSEEMILQKNQRLIISQMLARHKDDITSVKGFPDWYEAQEKDLINSNNQTKQDLEKKNAERAKNTGLDDNEH